MKNDIYEDYNGGKYRLLMSAKHTENRESLVVYESLDSGMIYARPSNIFFGSLEINGETIQRFKFIEKHQTKNHLVELIDEYVDGIISEHEFTIKQSFICGYLAGYLECNLLTLDEYDELRTRYGI